MCVIGAEFGQRNYIETILLQWKQRYLFL